MRELTPEQKKAYYRAYRERNRKKIRASQHAWYVRNKDLQRERQRTPEQKAKTVARCRAWYERNKDLEREKRRTPEQKAKKALRRASPRYKFMEQKNRAAQRGIPFLLTFEQWWLVWQQSGHWHERGCRNGAYVMARNGDCGPYSADNVKIIRHEENVAEQSVFIKARRAAEGVSHVTI